MKNKSNSVIIKFFGKALRTLSRKLFYRFTRAQKGISTSRVFSTWEQALSSCINNGYASYQILERTSQSTQQVLNGEKQYIRDAVAFDTIQLDYPALFHLLNLPDSYSGSLVVIDFGGALGSTFLACRKLCSNLRIAEWVIVEQPDHVDEGIKLFADNQVVSFVCSIEELRHKKPSIIIFSGVLMYLENPISTLDKVLKIFPETPILIDRTIFLKKVSSQSIISTQIVDPSIFGKEMSYPMWIFSEQELLQHFIAHQITKFDSLVDPGGLDYFFKGYYIEPSCSVPAA